MEKTENSRRDKYIDKNSYQLMCLTVCNSQCEIEDEEIMR